MITYKQLTYFLFISLLALLIVAGFRTNIPHQNNTTTGDRLFSAAPGVTLGLSEGERKYLTIDFSLNKKSSFLISDWYIKNSRGEIYRIGKASTLPKQGQINSESPILIQDNSSVIIESGRSPLGVSFRVNSCSGYLSQFQKYNPPITEECPLAEDVISPEEKSVLDAGCLSYIKSIPRCHNPIMDTDLNSLSSQCRDLLMTKINYNSCVARYSVTDDFYKNEWRIFLDKNNSIWGGAFEILTIFDDKGRVIGSLSH